MKRGLTAVFSIFVGIVTGFLNGFFGGGGGMVCVPMLELMLKYNNKKAHATTMLIILPLSIVSATVYLMNNFIYFQDILITIFGVLFGGVLGAFLLKKLPENLIAILFCFLMFVAGIKMVI